MSNHSDHTKATYAGKLRLRACGVLVEKGKLLMVKHRGLGKGGYLWIPPGGGVESAQSLEQTVKREFLEETGLEVALSQFLFVNEFISGGFHAVEMFFEVHRLDGELITGADPEMAADQQIIEEVAFLSLEQLRSEGPTRVHSRFSEISSFDELLRRKGFFNFENNYLK